LNATSRIALVSIITILLFVTTFSIAYYLDANYATFPEDAYGWWLLLGIATLAFAVLFLIIDIVLINTSTVEQKKTGRLGSKPLYNRKVTRRNRTKTKLRQLVSKSAIC
jgi:uncharacterized membrane protein